ncbi:MAG: glycosyltransferase family 39 protein [Pyrinomonadaceae bacterium]
MPFSSDAANSVINLSIVSCITIKRLAHKSRKHRRLALALFGLAAALTFNIWIAVNLANDAPDDGKLYSQLARNLVQNGVFSAETEAPFNPTLIRLPGYPLFLAAIYSVGGGDESVRIIQAIFSVGTAILAALIAWNWKTGTRRRRRKAALWTFALTAFCPFTAIFSATILTEALTMFYLGALTLAATYALKAKGRISAIAYWFAAGAAAGIAVLLRPDSGLFALGIGLTLAISPFVCRPPEIAFLSRSIDSALKGMVFSAAFVIILLPWTIRNEHVFGIFQPLAPAHAEMPGEFVPKGYLLWVRTWIDDSRYIGPMLWDLEEKKISIDAIPSYAFASEAEKQQVVVLLAKYNNSDPEEQAVETKPEPDDGDQPEDGDGPADEQDDSAGESRELNLKISPEVDAGFQEIAEQRIEREPGRYYIWLPAKRASIMWFDTHSEYYPFGGEIFPVEDLDNEKYQNIWLPLFGAVTWIYSLLAVVGSFILITKGQSRLWGLMALLLAFPRIAFFGTLENPEPRYLVELFVVAAILGGIVLSRLRLKLGGHTVAVEFRYRSDR